MGITELVERAEGLPAVPSGAAEAYRARSASLIERVNVRLLARPDLQVLIGSNPVEVMTANHEHHAAFLGNVLALWQPGLLARTLPWVYRSYTSRGFSLEYFLVELEAWSAAIEELLQPPDAAPVLAVYRWMRESHGEVVALSREVPDAAPDVAETEDSWAPVRHRYLAALLTGDAGEALEVARSVTRVEELEGFFVSVVQPALQEIGRRWEAGVLSIAQEHLASAITTRVIAGLGPVRASMRTWRGEALVTSAPNEFHEIGAWMLADLLEADGWSVAYLGANTPERELVGLARERKPSLVALSVTMPFNLDRTRTLIRALRADPVTAGVHVMVGGGAFAGHPGLWSAIGADAWAADAGGAVRAARAFGRREAPR